MSRPSFKSRTVRIWCFQKFKKVALAGIVFLCVNMLYQSLRFPQTKNGYGVPAVFCVDRDSRLVLNKTNDERINEIEHTKPGEDFENVPQSRVSKQLQQSNVNIPRTIYKNVHSTILREKTDASKDTQRILSPQHSDSGLTVHSKKVQNHTLNNGPLVEIEERFKLERPLVERPPVTERPTNDLSGITGLSGPVIPERSFVAERPLFLERQFVRQRPHKRPLLKERPLSTPSPVGDGKLAAFKPRVGGRDLRILQDILDAFSTAMQRERVPFFLYSGSLLGSWRHHGLVPWDDDVDFAVPRANQQHVYRVLSDLKPRFRLDVRQKVRWKFFSDRSHPIKKVTWSWPFVDISFYLENGTQVWDQDDHFPDFCFPRPDVFPLRSRPFMGRTLPAPRDAEAVLRRTYNMSLCKVGRYNHHKESFNSLLDMQSVSCSWLQNVFPFVKRVPLKTGCNETLVRNGAVISWFLVHDRRC